MLEVQFMSREAQFMKILIFNSCRRQFIDFIFDEIIILYNKKKFNLYIQQTSPANAGDVCLYLLTTIVAVITAVAAEEPDNHYHSYDYPGISAEPA